MAHSDAGPALGSLIRGYRMRSGLTQPELAGRAGISVRGLRDLESGVPDGYRLRTGLDASTFRALVTMAARALADGDRSGCLGLVTSRSALAGLVVAAAASPVPVEPLSPRDARALLTARIGAARAAAEPRAVRDLVDRCPGLPIALAVVAAYAAARPDQPLARLAAELRSGSALPALLRAYATEPSGTLAG